MFRLFRKPEQLSHTFQTVGIRLAKRITDSRRDFGDVLQQLRISIPAGHNQIRLQLQHLFH
ncbi:hypothetical protein D3C84_1243680 [compost metagenome]